MSTHPTAAISIADGEITIDAELLASNALLRAMGILFLGEKDCTRESLARELRERLDTPCFDYHVRTLKRQLTGSVSAVPPELGGHAPCPAAVQWPLDGSRY